MGIKIHKISFIFIFLFIYGFSTVYYTAIDTQITADEETYQILGIKYLSTHDFSVHTGHLPFSSWAGAVYPYFKTYGKTYVDFRLFHILLFLLGGIYVAFLIKKCYGWKSAFLFSIFYNFCPIIKFFAALHINDFDSAIFIAASALSLRAVSFEIREKKLIFLLMGSGFFAGLSILSKFSTLLFGPFLALEMFYLINDQNKKNFFKIFFMPLIYFSIGFIFSIFVAYHFRLSQIIHFIDPILFQLDHNKAGHSSSILGQRSEKGFWFYYIVLFLTKIPSIFLLGIFLSWIVIAKNVLNKKIKSYRNILLFFISSLSFFVYLSLINVQIGFRYFLPGYLLLIVVASIYLPDITKIIKLRKNYHNSVITWLFLIVLLVAIDIHTLDRGSYLSSFNLFAPKPHTRNFSDSNIDWFQGIPIHLKKKYIYPNLYEVDASFVEALEQKEPVYFIIGASHLNGVSGILRGMLFKAFSPEKEIAGYEVFKLTRKEIALLAREAVSPLEINESHFKILQAKIHEERTVCGNFEENFQIDFAKDQKIDSIKEFWLFWESKDELLRKKIFGNPYKPLSLHEKRAIALKFQYYGFALFNRLDFAYATQKKLKALGDSVKYILIQKNCLKKKNVKSI